jgi:PBP1b-binding outer membrane lipoprotein LpoB
MKTKMTLTIVLQYLLLAGCSGATGGRATANPVVIIQQPSVPPAIQIQQIQTQRFQPQMGTICCAEGLSCQIVSVAPIGTACFCTHQHDYYSIIHEHYGQICQ